MVEMCTNSKIIDQQMNNFQPQAPATTGSELNKAFFLQYQLGDYGVNLILLIIISSDITKEMSTMKNDIQCKWLLGQMH